MSANESLERLLRDAAGNNNGLTSVQFARLRGVGIEQVARWRRGTEEPPPGWRFIDGRWQPYTRSSEQLVQ
ncbi:hypothetical protein [Nostoc sp. FACHB-280]|jgi:hypothetical protein|uniref:hypothetical protein n=1 Tax=Nostoc sp. FACHB-280 TaxID=2692839 RepID=UPI00168BF0BD|nr:hypothetical protein [Nostoc sp. FACHB-280]MBD2498439.1 hypothetical protein [Nostoc sp. FACHB-280]